MWFLLGQVSPSLYPEHSSAQLTAMLSLRIWLTYPGTSPQEQFLLALGALGCRD
jgi:hypothetical protein